MPNASNGPASHLNPAADSPATGRRDCTGIPFSIGDIVEFLDAGQMQILAFDGQDRFVYEENGARRTFPCVAVTLIASISIPRTPKQQPSASLPKTRFLMLKSFSGCHGLAYRCIGQIGTVFLVLVLVCADLVVAIFPVARRDLTILVQLVATAFVLPFLVLSFHTSAFDSLSKRLFLGRQS